VCFLVAGDADETDLRLRYQRVRLVDHPKARAQHRHQQRRIGQPRPHGVGHRRADRHGRGRGVAGGLVNEHQRQVAQSGAERRVVGALVAQGGQPCRGQRVIDNTNVHALEP
jgi:hypothetical protein